MATSSGSSVPIWKGSRRGVPDFRAMRPGHSGATVPDSHRVPRTATRTRRSLTGAYASRRDPAPPSDADRLRPLAGRRARRRPARLAVLRHRARRGRARHRRAPRHPSLPGRRGRRRRPAARARGGPSRAVGGPHAAVALHRRARRRHPRRHPLARAPRAAAPGRSLRRARPPLPRPEDRGHRRGAAGRVRVLRPRRSRCRGSRPRHDPGDRHLQHRLRRAEPVVGGARGGARRRVGELLPPGRPS